MVAAFVGLGWWQAGRAADGNTLSWAYTFEWPVFAVFVIVLWIREMRQTLGGDRPEEPKAQSPQRRGPVITRQAHGAWDRPDDAASDEAADPRLAAYNRYLAWLSAHPEAKPNDYPG
jgi:hypothetical protein